MINGYYGITLDTLFKFDNSGKEVIVKSCSKEEADWT